MIGVNAYDCSSFHPACQACEVIDIGGIPYLWCPSCKVLSNLQAVSAKFQDYANAVKGAV